MAKKQAPKKTAKKAKAVEEKVEEVVETVEESTEEKVEEVAETVEEKVEAVEETVAEKDTTVAEKDTTVAEKATEEAKEIGKPKLDNVEEFVKYAYRNRGLGWGSIKRMAKDMFEADLPDTYNEWAYPQPKAEESTDSDEKQGE